MFVLKKILGHLLMPLPLGLGLLTIGVLLVSLRSRSVGWRFIALGWLVLLVSSNRGTSIALTSSLEGTFPPVPVAAPAEWPETLRNVNFVAILGSGHGDAAALPAGQRLSPSARARLLEGVRIANALPETWLVTTGPLGKSSVGDRGARAGAAPSDIITHARALADAAVELGFPRERIVEIDHSRDTAEEISALRQLVGEERLALVTSAWHLPRAMRLAEGEGLDAFPCPADYLGSRDAVIARSAWVTWDVESLANTTRAWREYLGKALASIAARWRA
jgi:uncharacterized SAM-binding protein YcdF (DUF218 family)